MREKAKVDFDGTQKILPGFDIGANVYNQDPKTKRWNHRGTIVRILKNNRTYQVRINGRLFWRNRKFLRKDPEDPVVDQNTPEKPEVPQLCRSKRT